jgi:S-adenosylmethionine:tRNA ribosyltransferase-isomerase
MTQALSMRVDLFDFDLPEDRIALRPASPRDAARMLVVRPRAGLEDRTVRDLPDLLLPGDAVVVNDTKVIAARLQGTRDRAGSAARVEIMLHRRLGPETWLAFARPAKRLAVGDVVRFGEGGESAVCFMSNLEAVVEARGEGGEVRLRFGFTGPALDEAVALLGEVPLPPYIAGRRAADDRDRADYQTMFAADAGAVAAPTAGLHMTAELVARLEARGISCHRVTLHVGAGTFLPVKADDTREHRMHPEWGTVTPQTAFALAHVRSSGGRVVAIGTTSLRLLESAAAADGYIGSFAGETDLFITPGYRFRAVDILMTNFHLPRSTLFMLVAAFAGLETMQGAYRHAIEAGYRFYSYGDASLLFRADAIA